MAERPRVEGKISPVRGVSASGQKLACFLICATQGPLLEPTLIGTTAQQRTTYADGKGTEGVALYLDKTGLPALVIRVPSTNAGAVTHWDEREVSGSSAFSVTGTPFDDVEGIFEVLTGGTIGAAANPGITFRYSLDNGMTWKLVMLGAANTYVIPGSGLTLNFGAGSLVAEDVARFYAVAATPNPADCTDAMQQLRESSFLVRLIVPLFTLNEALAEELQVLIDEYFAIHQRDSQVVGAVRDWRPDAAMQGSAVSVTFADGPPGTATRGAGSWITDGFRVGMSVATTSPLNTGVRVIDALSATVMTFTTGSPAVVDEVTTASAHEGSETVVQWGNAIASEFSGVTSFRVDLGAGMLMQPASPVTRARPRRSVQLGYVIRAMSYDVHINAAKVANGALVGWDIDKQGKIVEYDERTEKLLLSQRFVVATTFDDEKGAFICMPRTRHPEDTDPYSRSYHVAVINKGNQVARKALIKQLGRDLVLDGDGHPATDEADSIDSYCTSMVRVALLTKGVDGPNASRVTFEMDRNVDLRIQGAEVGFTLDIALKGYLEQLRFTSSVTLPSQG